MSLFRAEFRRLGRRRLTSWMLALVLALMAVVAVVVAIEHQRPGPAATAAAEAAAEREYREQLVWMEQEIAACQQAQDEGTDQQFGWPEDCQEIRQWYPSQADLVQFNLPPAFEFRAGFGDMITVLVGLLAMAGFIVGASFVGAEWRSGGMMNLLLWRPRRLVVLGAKLLALLAALLGSGVLLGALWTGGFWLIARFRGITDTMTAGAWQSFGLAGLRGLALALVAGAIGFALASLGRHTAMAMGSAIAAFVVGVAGVGIIAGGMLQLPFWERWMWPTYLTAWLDTSVTLRDFTAPCEPGLGGDCVPPTMEITWQQSGVGIAVVVALLLGAAMWQMRRRDVT